MKLYIQDIIDECALKEMRDMYYSYNEYIEHPHMKKAYSNDAYALLKSKFDTILNEYRYVGGNYYFHEYPYLPHTDYKSEWGESINVVVPLTHTDAYLIVFDQKWLEDSVTWCFDYDDLNFEKNPPLPGKPSDYDIELCTHEPISKELFEKIGWRQREDWYGLSGEAFHMKPGNIILFDNQLIHATSNFNGTKLGVNFRFSKIPIK